MNWMNKGTITHNHYVHSRGNCHCPLTSWSWFCVRRKWSCVFPGLLLCSETSNQEKKLGATDDLLPLQAFQVSFRSHRSWKFGKKHLTILLQVEGTRPYILPNSPTLPSGKAYGPTIVWIVVRYAPHCTGHVELVVATVILEPGSFPSVWGDQSPGVRDG